MRFVQTLLSLVFFAGAFVVECFMGYWEDFMRENHVGNDRRRAIFKDSTIFTRYFAMCIQVSLGMIVVFAVGVVIMTVLAPPPPLEPYIACLTDDPEPSLANRLTTVAKHHGVWCSTIDVEMELPCLCCYWDGFCWSSADWTDLGKPGTLRMVDEVRDRKLEREMPPAIEVCYQLKNNQTCREETGPVVGHFFRALEMLKNETPVGTEVIQ